MPAALLAFALLTASADDAAAARESAASASLSVSADYAASVLVFRVGRVSLDADIAPRDYAAQAHVEAAGLAALFTDFEITSEVTGALSPDGPRPLHYGHSERTGEKHRRIDVNFADGTARPRAEPEFSSWGVPPASEAERTGVFDPMSAVLLLAAPRPGAGEDAPPCNGAVPVFDGKQRYDLELVARGEREVRTRAYRGPALVCDAYYAPISGYDPEDWPEPGETRHPLRIWFAPVAGGAAWLPVRAYTAAGFGGVTIEALSIAVE